MVQDTRQGAKAGSPAYAHRRLAVRRQRIVLPVGMILPLMLAPTAAFAEVCDKTHPDWDGAPASAVTEALLLAGSLPSVVLILATALAVRFRSAWGGLASVCGWSVMIGVIVFSGAGSGQKAIRDAAIHEGCAGAPALFIGVVAAICVATILYTAPNEGRSDQQEK